jgi:tRNA (guanine-N7-)-methyltransferase
MRVEVHLPTKGPEQAWFGSSLDVESTCSRIAPNHLTRSSLRRGTRMTSNPDSSSGANATSLGEDGEGRPADELRSFGRRHGRRLRSHQAVLVAKLLPRLRLDLDNPPPESLPDLFPVPVREIWLEIGFGGGEHLLWQASRNPNVGFIGCEPFVDGVAKVLSNVEAQGLRNIRLHDDDARDVIRWLPEKTISRAFILFPDPWPKKRHHKRRLVKHDLLRSLGRIMPPGSELRMASDIGDYAGQMLDAARRSGAFEWLARRPADWRARPDDWPSTRYEQKASRDGRHSYFLRFERVETAN